MLTLHSLPHSFACSLWIELDVVGLSTGAPLVKASAVSLPVDLLTRRNTPRARTKRMSVEEQSSSSIFTLPFSVQRGLLCPGCTLLRSVLPFHDEL